MGINGSKKISAAFFLDLLLDSVPFSCTVEEKWRIVRNKKGNLLYRKLSFRTKEIV